MLRFLQILIPAMSLSSGLGCKKPKLFVREPFPQSAFDLLTKVQKKDCSFEDARIGARRFVKLFSS
jgi:hypothetical protein